MANEIFATGGLSITKNGLTVSGSASISITQSGSVTQSLVQTIGVVTERLGGASGFVDVDDLGYLWLKNLDSTNYVMIGLATPVTSGDAFCVLEPGEFTQLPIRQETIYAIANASPVELQIVAIEK